MNSNIFENLSKNNENNNNSTNSKIQLFKNFIDCYKSPKMMKKFSNKHFSQKIKHNACKSLIKMMNEYFPKLPGLSNIKKFKLISPIFIRNSNIKYNNLYLNPLTVSSDILNQTLEQFLTHDFGDVNKINLQQNIENIKIINSQHPDDIFLKKNLAEVFILYFTSKYYEEDLEKIKNTEHNYYYDRYRELSKEFIKHLTITE